MNTTLPRRRALATLGLGAAAGALLAAGCTSMPGIEPPRVTLVGVERLKGEGLELRLALKLRVQNPGSFPLTYDGLSVELDVNGRPLASGVTNEGGSIGRLGEAVVTVPVSVSATAAVRQMMGLMDGSARRELPYTVRGRIVGGPLAGMAALGGGLSFVSEGSMKLPL